MQHPDVPMHLLRFVIRNKAQGSNLSVELPGTTENKELKEPKCCNDGISLFASFFFVFAFIQFLHLWILVGKHSTNNSCVTSISSKC